MENPKIYRKKLSCATKRIKKRIKTLLKTNPACKGFGAIWVTALSLQWNRIFVLYKRLINLQHKVCVTFANCGKRRNYTTELTILLLEKLWTETKTNWKQFEAEALYLSGSRAPVNHWRLSPEKVSKHFRLQSWEIIVFILVERTILEIQHCINKVKDI